MSAEVRRRMGTDLAPLDLAWQAWHFQRLSLDLRGRRGTFGTASGSWATNGGRFGAAGSCVAGVALSAPQPRFAWQAWYFQHLHRCPRKLRDEWGRFGVAGSCVAGVTLSAPQPRFAWQAWYTFGTAIDVSGSSATNGDRFGAAGSCVAGVALSAPQPRFAWQAWCFRYLHRCPRKLGDELGRIWRRWIRGRRDTLSAPEARFAWQACYFRYLHRCRGSLAANWVGFGAAIDCGSSATKGDPWTPRPFA